MVGVVIGLGLAAAASQLLGSLLFGVRPIDPATFFGSAALFAAIGFVASYAPARRATDIEATEALRSE